MRLTIYTALVGPKEPLNDPLAGLPPDADSDLELDFVCITDNRALRSDTWRFLYLDSDHLPPEKLSRRPKALPHEYFPDTELSLYIDNTAVFKRLPQAADVAGTLFRAFRHPDRTKLQQEADAIVALGYDDVATVCGQLDFYAGRRALDSITPLTTGTVLLRAHHHPAVRRFGVLWWESLLNFSKRDQLSIDFARLASGVAIDHFPGTLHDNDWIARNDRTDTVRVRASFDATRYAWLHRGDAEARRDPKAHFLAHGDGLGLRYLRRPPLLEYLCHQQRSSLGAQVSPRRGMAPALESLLAPLRRGGCRYLVVRVPDAPAPQAFDAGELDAATVALRIFLGREAEGSVIDLRSADLAALDKVYTAPQQPFDLLLLLGPAAGQLAAATHKLARLLRPQGGMFVAALASSATLADALRAQQLIEAASGSAVQVSLDGSRHDDLDTVLPNTVLGFSLATKTKELP